MFRSVVISSIGSRVWSNVVCTDPEKSPSVLVKSVRLIVPFATALPMAAPARVPKMSIIRPVSSAFSLTNWNTSERSMPSEDA